MNPLLQELRDFTRFFIATPAQEKKIVLYAEHEGYYAYYDGLIEELLTRHGQPLCYVTSDFRDPILKARRPGITPFYINKLLPYFMSVANCRVMVMTMPDLNQFHIKRSINNVHYVYVFHSMDSTHMGYRFGAFDYYDSILCVGPHQVKEIRRYEEMHQLKPKILVEAGYHRLERIHKAYQRLQTAGREASGRPVILIAPSWAPHNIIESCIDPLVANLLQAEFQVIIRPHPETRKHAPERIQALVEKYGKNPQVTIELSVATDDSLLKADVLITDWSAVSHEYAFGTERPALFIDVPRKVYNPRYEELGIEPVQISVRDKIGVVLPPAEIEKAATICDRMLRDKQSHREQIIDLRSQYVYAFGRSCEVGARHILDLIQAKS